MQLGHVQKDRRDAMSAEKEAEEKVLKPITFQ